MKSLEVSLLLALLGSLFTCPGTLAQNNNMCTAIWHVSVCAEETWDASTWTDSASVFFPENTSNGQLISTPGGGTVDIAITAYTSAGDQALVGVLDVTAFINQNPDINFSPVISACITNNPPACAAAIQTLANSVSQDKLKNGAIWWHGCQHASDSQNKTFAGLKSSLGGYLLAGQTKGGSNATLQAVITHHVDEPQSHTDRICGPVQTGSMPGPGDYTNKVVGHVSLSLSPQHGGTLSNTTFWTFSPVAKGHFIVDAAGNVKFTGNVSLENCPKVPPPQHGPIRPEPR